VAFLLGCFGFSGFFWEGFFFPRVVWGGDQEERTAVYVISYHIRTNWARKKSNAASGKGIHLTLKLKSTMIWKEKGPTAMAVSGKRGLKR